MDVRGHGGSDAPAPLFAIDDLADDVLALADHLRIQRTVLVGHSLGGMVAMCLAGRSPHPAGLLLLEGWTPLMAAGRAFSGARFYGALPPSAVLAIQRKSMETRHRIEPEVWARFWNSVERFNGTRFLRNATVPIIEAYGAMDRTE